MFVPGKHFRPSVMLKSEEGAYQSGDSALYLPSFFNLVLSL